MLRRLAWAFVLLLSGSPAFAETVVLTAVDWGTVNVLASRHAHAVGGGGLFGEDVAFFVFDGSEIEDPIVAATIRLQNPPGTFQSPQGVERFALYRGSEVNTLASIEVTPASPTVLELPVEERFLRVLERSAGGLLLNGRLVTLDKPGKPRERLFDGTGPSAVPPQIVVTTNPMAAPAAPLTIHVDAASAADSQDGTTAAPFRRISDALSVATPGDDVEVAPGTYHEGVALVEGVALRGSGADQTTLDFSAFDGPRPILCAEAARLEGFRILDPRPAEFALDAAISCAVGSSEIAHNLIEVGLRPAIVLTDGSQAWIHHNQIRGGPNAAWSMSMQTIMTWGTPVIEDNEIAATNAAIDLVTAGARVCRNVIRGFVEVRTDDLESGEVTVCDNLFLPSVETPRRGGLLRDEASDPAPTDPVAVRVLGNTFHDTPGIRVLAGATTIANNVLANGTAGIEAPADSEDVEIRHNDVFGNRAGFMGATTNYVAIDDRTGSDGNISEDPDFVDAFFEDFRLRSGSPARDAGSDDEDDIAGEEDLDGDPRVVDDLDIGAQEFQPGEELPLLPLPIGVDLLPGKSPNELKFTKVAKGNGKVAVAILSDDALDAPADVDVATLILDREPVLRCSDKDVDRDDRRDLVCSFPLRGVSLAGWPLAVPPACVRGKTHDGRKLLGCDEVEIEP